MSPVCLAVDLFNYLLIYWIVNTLGTEKQLLSQIYPSDSVVYLSKVNNRELLFNHSVQLIGSWHEGLWLVWFCACTIKCSACTKSHQPSVISHFSSLGFLYPPTAGESTASNRKREVFSFKRKYVKWSDQTHEPSNRRLFNAPCLRGFLYWASGALCALQTSPEPPSAQSQHEPPVLKEHPCTCAADSGNSRDSAGGPSG